MPRLNARLLASACHSRRHLCAMWRVCAMWRGLYRLPHYYLVKSNFAYVWVGCECQKLGCRTKTSAILGMTGYYLLFRFPNFYHCRYIFVSCNFFECVRQYSPVLLTQMPGIIHQINPCSPNDPPCCRIIRMRLQCLYDKGQLQKGCIKIL